MGLKYILVVMAFVSAILVDHHFHSFELGLACFLGEVAILLAVIFVTKREYGR